jgi:predicted nuclease of predicted toxin-antitoxin system
VRFLLDENLPTSAAEPLRQAGHDVAAVAGSPLSGLPDPAIIQVCNEQARILITLDQGVFQPPTQLKTGLILLRARNELAPILMPELLKEFISEASEAQIAGRVTVISPGLTRSRPLEDQLS